jgi:hypothetical protein
MNPLSKSPHWLFPLTMGSLIACSGTSNSDLSDGGVQISVGGSTIVGTSQAGSPANGGNTFQSTASSVGGNSSTAGQTTSGGMNATGGSAATGGVLSTGGAVQSGGTNTTGGLASTGGLAQTGGLVATGGVLSTGGAVQSGGTNTTGGLASTGGLAQTGGLASSGGMISSGGAAQTGGNNSSGGVSSAAGASATGGNNSTGGSSAPQCQGQGVPVHVTGTITNTTGIAARAYIALRYPNSSSVVAGTGLQLAANESRNFDLRVGNYMSGLYTLEAILDTTGTGVPSRAEPAASVDISLNGADSASNILTITGPTLVAPPVPSIKVVIPTADSVLLGLQRVTDVSRVDFADRYRVYYSSDIAGGPPSPSHHDGVVQVPLDATAVAISGLTNGIDYAFSLSALAGNLESAASLPRTVKIAPPSGGFTVSGSASLSGLALTASSKVVTILYTPSGSIFATSSPAAANTPYSIAGVTAGEYRQIGFIDLNGDGIFSSVEPHVNFDTSPLIPVNSNLADVNYTVASDRVEARVNTAYEPGNGNYSLSVNVAPNTELPVGVVLCSGPNIVTPTDIGLEADGELHFSTWYSLPNGIVPALGDSYGLLVSYADGTTQYLSPSISAVLSADISLNAPASAISTLTPTFSWSIKGSLPSVYSQELWVWSGNYSSVWDDSNIDAATRSILYNADGSAMATTLSPGVTYSWKVRIRDAFGNTIESTSSSFTPGP